ncbi:hypothetical protein BRADI_4g31650v3 [Brachypodium distachyon]|uniref:tRNA pseudouridine(55) synthase n=1 Tax=Brachypodium distachyon TaxID=15368 RepID=I1IQK4_BRADI|nr:hypothetical protein BRADI_4g31650v3 [Brachypodium distachyon]
MGRTSSILRAPGPRGWASPVGLDAARPGIWPLVNQAGKPVNGPFLTSPGSLVPPSLLLPFCPNLWAQARGRCSPAASVPQSPTAQPQPSCAAVAETDRRTAAPKEVSRRSRTETAAFKMVFNAMLILQTGYESLMILFPIVSFHKICDGFKFHASGREDINVRMLNLDLVSGHPFLIEVLIARSITYASEVEQSAEKIKIAPKRNISELEI